MGIAKKITLTIIMTVVVALTIASATYAATGIVTTETLRLRKEPSTNSNIVRNLDEGDELQILSEEGDWYKVSYKGDEGYVSSKYVKVSGVVSPTTDVNKNNTDVDKPDTDVPEIEIEEPDVPLSDVPKTADNNAAVLWMMMALLSAAVLMGIRIAERKER